MSGESPSHAPARVASIDALRGLIVLVMPFVNDFADVSHAITPAWMRHHPGPSGFTFVDLIAYSYLFIVGMAIPFAIEARRTKGDSTFKIAAHALGRSLALVAIGVMMINDMPDAGEMTWRPDRWLFCVFLAAILATCWIGPPRGAGTALRRCFAAVSIALRIAGFAGMAWLATLYRDAGGMPMVAHHPFSIFAGWYQVLGLIGIAYAVGVAIHLVFGRRPTALLGCMALLMLLYPADRAGAFANNPLAKPLGRWWITEGAGIGNTIGSRGAVCVAGMLVATLLAPPQPLRRCAAFALLFAAGCAAAAWLAYPIHGANWYAGSPSLCLAAVAVDAMLWLGFAWLCAAPGRGRWAAPFQIAGRNILLAYLLSYIFNPALGLMGLEERYRLAGEAGLGAAIARSAGCALFLIALTTGLNRIGLRLKL